MYAIARSVPVRRALVENLPSLTVALLTAERFYKFHSFTLECIAFLATWGVFDEIGERLLRLRRRRTRDEA